MATQEFVPYHKEKSGHTRCTQYPNLIRDKAILRLPLEPLRLQYRGTWDPDEEYWGEPDQPVDPVFLPIIAAGRRPWCEMEQLLPGSENDDVADDIIRSSELRQAGYRAETRELLSSVIEIEPRCIDAHVHLGNMLFDANPKGALSHYQTGVAIGERALPFQFEGVLPWSNLDNRPFLRALNGMTLCFWRLRRFEEAEAAVDVQLWLNPADIVGVRFIRDDIRDRISWVRDPDDDE